jgi:hypothetical protein
MQTYQDFARQMAMVAAEFLVYWRRNHAEDPLAFPAEMKPGEWDEQFRAFCAVCPEDRVSPDDED